MWDSVLQPHRAEGFLESRAESLDSVPCAGVLLPWPHLLPVSRLPVAQTLLRPKGNLRKAGAGLFLPTVLTPPSFPFFWVETLSLSGLWTCSGASVEVVVCTGSEPFGMVFLGPSRCSVWRRKGQPCFPPDIKT